MDSLHLQGKPSALGSTNLPTANWQTILVVSQDVGLTIELRSYLEQDHGCRVIVTSSIHAASHRIRTGDIKAVFLDLQLGETWNELDFVAQWRSYGDALLPIYALVQRGYDRTWAGAAQRLFSGHLRLPLVREQLASLLRGTTPGGRQHHAPSESHQILQGETVQFATHVPELFPLIDRLQSLARHDVTLLLVGETGCGKARLARLIHELSPRRDGRFWTIPCGALPRERIGSELFGHVKGAFSGADCDKSGRLEAAAGGTLLVDEIDVLDSHEQSKLLRVIETGEYEPVGSTETRQADTRLIVASNVDLKDLLTKNRFRADLYYRLNTLEFVIPPLRKRVPDIVPLALDFIDELCRGHRIAIDQVHPEFLDALPRYSWPGNIRELKNHMRRAVLFCRGRELTIGDLAADVLGGATPHKTDSSTPLADRVARTEKELLTEALVAHAYKREVTARALGISRVGLYKKMKKHGLLDLKSPAEGRLNHPAA